VEAGGDRGNKSLLAADGFAVEIRIHAAENFGKEGEEGELYGKAVFPRGHQICFERAEGAFVGAAGLVAELIPAGPPAGAKHVQPGTVDERKIAVPDVDVRVVEIEALDLAGHVGGADNGEGPSIDGEVVGIDAKARAGAEVGFITHPKGGVVDGA